MYRITSIAAFIGVAISGAAFTTFAADDATRGKTAYEANCAACHTVMPGKHGFGPSLAGVVGRDAGTIEGYRFSGAMAQSGVHWDAKNLDEFLVNSTKKIPGTAMDLAVPSAADRAAIIAYLGTIQVPQAPRRQAPRRRPSR